MKRILFSLGFGVLLAGCQHAELAKPTGLRPEAFWKEQQARLTDTKMISSHIYFRYQNEAKKQNVGGPGRLVLQAPDDLRMELRDPLGRLQFLVTMRDQSFVAAYPRQNVAYLDQKGGAAYLRRVLGLNVSFRELKNLLVGVVPDTLKKGRFDSWEWDGAQGVYVGTFDLKQRKVLASVNPKTASLVGLKIESGKAKENASIQYTDFSPCCSGSDTKFALGHNVALRMDDTGAAVTVEWEKLEAFREPKPKDVFEADLSSQTRKVSLN